ncbi:MAG: ATP-binding protein [Chloroflexi bacterium]|nr:ATP-binding protein [Chloroflexota bacterium]
MIPKDLDQIKEEDLQALKENSVPEGKTLEYKQELPSSLDADKKEFLADVSSFANASGGDLIFGVIEDRETGTIESLEGLTIENVDQEILRLDDMIRDGIEPRIPSVSISPPIPLINSKVALVIRVPKSWISPHRVSFRGHDKFYSRSSNGKYPLDVAELRVAFNLSETMTERIRNFRLDRISKIYANETPVPFYDNAKIALHLVPIISFNPAQSYDASIIASDTSKMPPMHSYGWNNRYNLDGFLTHSDDQERISYSYVQFYRNGIIEAVEGQLLQPYKGQLIIPSIAYEQELIKSFTGYLSLLKTLDVEPPIFVFLTLLGVKGYSMAVSERFSFARSHTIDRDILQLPEVILESYDVIPEKVLKPCFDSIWNACGFPKSFNYNDAGEWAPR